VLNPAERAQDEVKKTKKLDLTSGIIDDLSERYLACGRGPEAS
jgi:hypothetical protein